MGNVTVVRSDEPPPSPETELAAWRRRVLQRLLNATTIAAAIAYVPGAWAAIEAGAVPVLAINTLVWASMAGLAIWRTGPYRVRALAYSIIWLALAVALLVLLGPMGAGAVWLLATPLLATVLFGRREGSWTIAAVVAIAIGYGVTLSTVGTTPLVEAVSVGYDVTSWSATAGSLVFLAVLLVGAMGALQVGMATYAERVRSANVQLAAALLERERLEATLVATAKARALGSLAAGIAHDLNNLLVPITVAGTAARDASHDRRQRDRLDLVLSAADRARLLARRVLAFSDEGAPERRAVAVAPLVQDVVELVRASIPTGVAVLADVDGDAGDVVADPGEVQQVVMNLCTNAVRALTGTVGTLSVRLQRPTPRGPIVLEVADDGAGMDADTLTHAFEPYFTTHRDGDGTGLGLAIVRHLVDTLGGTITLESTPGRGTRCVVRLPPAPSSVDPGERTSTPPAPSRG